MELVRESMFSGDGTDDPESLLGLEEWLGSRDIEQTPLSLHEMKLLVRKAAGNWEDFGTSFGGSGSESDDELDTIW